MSLQLTIFQTGCGDAISIGYTGKSGKYRRIMVDSGYMNAYYRNIAPWLAGIPQNEQIDLWILTHLDADHLNGAYAYFSDNNEEIKKGLLHTLWFNFFGDFGLSGDTESIGYEKAIKLRDRLTAVNCRSVNHQVTTAMPDFDLDGATITILSPDTESYERLKAEWSEEEEKFHEAADVEDVASSGIEHDRMTIATLAGEADRIEDARDVTNRSSIAFLLEYEGETLLMLGDAFPSIIHTALKKLLAMRGLEKLKADYVKLAHHGSIKNFSRPLFDLIDCYQFILCSNGYNNSGLPNKETLAKLLIRENKEIPVTFFCNYASDRYTDMFEVDSTLREFYNFSFVFPEDDAPYLQIPQ